jgi:ferredoxin
MSGSPTGPRLRVDWTRCDGHGLCARMWPDGVALDEWGFPVVEPTALEGESVTGARRAVQVCPRLALRLESA